MKPVVSQERGQVKTTNSISARSGFERDNALSKAWASNKSSIMLIGLKKKFIFVANTKTASTSIEEALSPFAEITHGGDPRRKHISLYDGLNAYPQVFRQPGQWPRFFFKFGVMRDPIEWIGSWFRYRKSNRVESPLPADMTFEEFWKRGDWNFRRAGDRPFLQRDMFCGPEGRVLADMIIPYGQLEPMFAQICDALGIERGLPRENVSRLRTMDEISPNMETRLREFYAPDYALMARLPQINQQGLDRLMTSS
jgi:hypothetical protein